MKSKDHSLTLYKISLIIGLLAVSLFIFLKFEVNKKILDFIVLNLIPALISISLSIIVVAELRKSNIIVNVLIMIVSFVLIFSGFRWVYSVVQSLFSVDLLM